MIELKVYIVSKRSESYSEKVLNGFELLRNTERFSLWARLSDCCSVQALDFISSNNFVRVFESCYITSLDEAESRIEATRLLFSELAGNTYKSVIEVGRNLNCYNSLYFGAKKNTSLIFKDVLDYGCGPGTIISSELYTQAHNLIVYDFIEENRVYAGSLGLGVLSTIEFNNLIEESLDLIVCCYVLHYMSVDQQTVSLLMASLRVGGVLAANFHKGTGVDWFLNCVNSIEDIRVVRENSEFGDLVFIVKGARYAEF